jgi:hypothetical protein
MPIKGTFTLDIIYWSSPQSVSSIVLEFWRVNPNFVLHGYFVATGSYGWNSTSVIGAVLCPYSWSRQICNYPQAPSSSVYIWEREFLVLILLCKAAITGVSKENLNPCLPYSSWHDLLSDLS